MSDQDYKQIDELLARMPKPSLSDQKKQQIYRELLNTHVKAELNRGRWEMMKHYLISACGIGALAIIAFVVISSGVMDDYRSKSGMHSPEEREEWQGNLVEDQEDNEDNGFFPIDVDQLKAYVGTYIGGASDVFAIIEQLPGADTYQGGGLDLRDQILGVTYLHANVEASPEAKAFWYEEGRMEKVFLHNAIYLTLLVPNAVGYHFEVGLYSFSVSRDEMVDILQTELTDFPQGNEIWEREVMDPFLDQNVEKINELVQSEEFRASFFAEHPIMVVKVTNQE